MEELKPCPFCGSNESRSRSTDRYGEFRHIGTGANCPISGQIFTPKLWNTRIPPATAGKSVDVGKLARLLLKIEDPEFSSGANSWERLSQICKNRLLRQATAIKEAIDNGTLK